MFQKQKSTQSICAHRTSIAVIGTGMVGSSFAYAAMIRGLAAELILIDASEEREAGEVMDLSHGLIGTETGQIRGGQMKDCGQADIIVITAGAAQKPGETRLDLVQKNVAIFKSIVKQMGPLKKEAIVIIVSNPVDILTYFGRKWIKLPPQQIFGTGTSLDTFRFRYLISHELGVSPNNVHGYILGEHGDSELPAWSITTVGGTPVTRLISAKKRQSIFNQTTRAAYEIIQRKHATYYGIGVVISELVEHILHNQRWIIPVSADPGGLYGIHDVSLGIPVVLGCSGIQKIWPIKLDAKEQRLLKKSAETLKAVIAKVRF